MRIEWAVVGLVVGCGSSAPTVDAGAADAAPDATPDAPADACPLGAWGSPQLIGELVSASDDASPWISDDRLELVFESSRGGSRRIYLTTRLSTAEPFGPPVLVDTKIINVQGTPTISDDGHDLYFTAGQDQFPSSYPNAYTAKRTARGQPFTGARYFGFGIYGLERAPNGEFFVDSRNSLGLELLVTRLMPNGFFEQPTRLSTPPNTDGDECCGQLTPEGLVYSGTLGGTRTLLVSTRISFEVFSAPQEYAPVLAPPSGSENHDFHLTSDGGTLVFASNRPGGPGGFDLYVAERPCL